MSKPQGSEWIYSPASILFGPNGPVVPSPCGINNTERKDEQVAERKQAGREGGETSPPLEGSQTVCKTNKRRCPEGHGGKD